MSLSFTSIFGKTFQPQPSVLAFTHVFKFTPDQPRDPKGTATGGQFASAGVQSSPALVQQSVAGIAAVEQLIPEALKSLEYAPQSWEDVDPDTKEAMLKEWHSRVPTITRAEADDVFDKMPNYHKLAQLHEAIHDKLIPQPLSQPPKHWRTGLEITDTASVSEIKVEYDRTRELAVKLVELRTTEVMQQRGLLKPPAYTIKDDFGVYNAKGELLHQASSRVEAEDVAQKWQQEQFEFTTKIAADIPSEVWKRWKNSSGSGLALSLQLAAAQELGGHHRLTPREVTEAEERAEDFGYNGMDMLRAYVRAQWEVTQTVLDKAGQQEIETYRALMLRRKDVDATEVEFQTPFGKVLKPTNIRREDETPSGAEVHFEFDGRSYTSVKRQMNNGEFEGDTSAINRRLEQGFEGLHRFNMKLPNIALKRAGLQSTTSLSTVANTWDGAGKIPADPVRVVLRFATPRTSVLSLPVFGQNVQSEQEAVLIGTQDHWLWDAWRHEAPTFSTNELAKKFDPHQARGPKGTSTGGQWVKEGGKEYLVYGRTEAPLVGRTFTSEEGYQFHETGPVAAWAKALPYKDSQVLNGYAGFGYHSINDYRRGTFVPRMISGFVRPATLEEAEKKFQITDEYLKQFSHPFGRSDTDWTPEDPLNRVVDAQGNYVGHVVHNVFFTNPAGEKVEYSVQRTMVNQEELDDVRQKADHMDRVIAEQGYVLPEAIQVERGAYLPGVTYEDLQHLAESGEVLTEKGFTSTMVGEAGGRARSYPALGKSESIYNRYQNEKIAAHWHEEGSAIRFHIILPAGTKVAPIETLRRLEYEFPRIPDPSPRPADVQPEYWTMRDYTAQPMVKDEGLQRKESRSESEVLLGSGARFRVRKVQHGEKISTGDSTLGPVQIEEVWLEYIGGGSSDGHVH